MAVIVLIIGVSGGTMAQPPKKALERIELMKKMKLLEILNLDEATAEKFLIKFNVYENKLKDKKEELDRFVDELRDNIKDKESNETLAKKTEKAIQLQEELQHLFLEKLKYLKPLLNDEQYAKYIVFESKFQEELRRIIMEKLENRDSYKVIK